jgi:hypothetical protein
MGSSPAPLIPDDRELNEPTRNPAAEGEMKRRVCGGSEKFLTEVIGALVFTDRCAIKVTLRSG